MAKGIHEVGAENILKIVFNSNSTSPPGTDDFKLHLANSLLLQLSGTSTDNWSIGETVEGSSSSDTGVLEDIKSNGDGTVTLKLSGIGETEVFTIGETVAGQYSGASGSLENGNLNLNSISNGYFQNNEQITDQSTGATADLKALYGTVVAVNNISGSFGVGNTIQGQESGATANISKHYAGIPGLFSDDSGVGDIVDEATNYTPPTLSSNSTDWPTISQDLAGNYYIESKEITITADGGDLGPINLGILTMDIGDGEEIISTSPISGTPPSEVISSGGNIFTKYMQKFGG